MSKKTFINNLKKSYSSDVRNGFLLSANMTLQYLIGINSGQMTLPDFIS